MCARDALTAIGRAWPEYAAWIGRVRPYHYREPEGQKLEIRVLYLWTGNDSRARSMIYELAPEIAASTGWYPMVTGRYGAVFKADASLTMRSAKAAPEVSDVHLGRPRLFRTVIDKRHAVAEGVSFELVCDQGSLLLDVGMKETARLVKAAERAHAIVISHAHQDHADVLALAAVIHHSAAPLLMTELTLHQLVSLTDLHISRDAAGELARRSWVVGVNEPLRLACGSEIEFYHANHSPGAVMTLVTAPSGRTLLYTGDVSITNAYSDGVLNAIRGTSKSSLPREIDFAVIDGRMLGRGDPALVEHYYDDAIRSAIEDGRHLLILADTADIGVRLYLELYRLALQGATRERDLHVYVDREIGHLIVALNRLRSRAATAESVARELDDVFSKLFLTRKNVFEGQHLFEIDERAPENIHFDVLSAKRIFCITVCPRKAGAIPSSAMPMLTALREKPVDVLLVGPVAESPLGTILVHESRLPGIGRIGGHVVPLTHLMWRVHSAPEDIGSWLRGDLSQTLRQGRLFHTSDKHISEGIAKMGFANPSIAPIQSEEDVSAILA